MTRQEKLFYNLKIENGTIHCPECNWRMEPPIKYDQYFYCRNPRCQLILPTHMVKGWKRFSEGDIEC